MVLFYCTCLALRFEDMKTPVGDIQDFEIHKEKVIFSGSVRVDTCLLESSRHPDVLSMITTSTPSDYSKRKTRASSDSKLPCKRAL